MVYKTVLIAISMLDKSCEAIAKNRLQNTLKGTPKKSASHGKLYLLMTLGESEPLDVLPHTVKKTIEFIDDYIVENEKQHVNL